MKNPVNNRMIIIKPENSIEFIQEFNNNKVSEDFLASCKKAGKLFGRNDVDIHLKAEVYSALINDMQARIMEFEKEHPNHMNDDIRSINQRLSDARMKSRIYVDENHFLEWENLLDSADEAMLRAVEE